MTREQRFPVCYVWKIDKVYLSGCFHLGNLSSPPLLPTTWTNYTNNKIKSKNLLIHYPKNFALLMIGFSVTSLSEKNIEENKHQFHTTPAAMNSSLAKFTILFIRYSSFASNNFTIKWKSPFSYSYIRAYLGPNWKGTFLGYYNDSARKIGGSDPLDHRLCARRYALRIERICARACHDAFQANYFFVFGMITSYDGSAILR